jgi:hypothetical protein
MKLYGKLSLIFLLIALSYCSSNSNRKLENYEGNFVQGDTLSYNLSLEELVNISIKPDTTSLEIEPSYNQSLEDLVSLNVTKELTFTTTIKLTSDLSLEDLMQIDVSSLNDEVSGTSFSEISLDGLMALEVEQKAVLKDKLLLSYDMPIENLLRIHKAMLTDEP